MKTLLAAAALVLPGAASAATVFATAVDWSNDGTVGGANDRDDASNALGAPDGDFLTLGLTNADGTNPGFAVFAFDGLTFGQSDATLWEITFNCRPNAGGACNMPEAVDVYYGTGYAFGGGDFADLADFTLAGTIFNGDAQGGASLIIPGTFTYIALVDSTLANFPGSSSGDGFEGNALGVNPAPVPGAALLFAPAIAGGLIARRRKT